MTGPAREGGAGEAAWLAWSDAEETNLTPCSDAFLAGWRARGAADVQALRGRPTFAAGRFETIVMPFGEVLDAIRGLDTSPHVEPRGDL